MYNHRERKRTGKAPAAPASTISKQPKTSIIPTPLSMFERLPRELHWAIFDYAPSMIRAIMKTTPIIHTRVIEYAKESTHLQIVDSINFDWGQNFCSLSVLNALADLLELRCALRSSRWKWRYDPEIGPTHSSFKFHFHYRTDSMLEDIRDALGKRVGTVSPQHRLGTFPPERFQAVVNLLEGVKINKFTYLDTTLPQCISDYILRLAPNIKHMQLELLRTETDAVAFLLELSASVTSLNIIQYATRQRAYTNDGRNFLGLVDEKWAPIIMQMFSKKLNKLSITNADHRDFLRKGCADFLIKNLPLQEKKIWFSVTCPHYPTGTIYSENDGYVVKVSEGQALTIKHATREHETYD